MKLIFTLVSMFLTAFAVGAAEPVPYKHVFDTENSLEGWTTTAVSERTKFTFAPKGDYRFKYPFKPGVGSRNLYSTGEYDYKNAWLISPAVELEAGREYKVKYTLCMTDECLGNVGIFYGTSANAEAMKETVLPMAKYLGKGFSSESCIITLEGFIVPKTSGNYYIGFFDDSAKEDSPTTVIFDMEVLTPPAPGAPGRPTDVTVTPNPEGRLSATITCKAPTKTVEGNTLTALTALDFLVNDEVVKTIENPTPGQVYSEVVSTTRNGNNTFGVEARNANGAGNSVNLCVSVGADVPHALTNVSARQTEPGIVHFSWTKPGQDVRDNPLHPDVVTVKIEVYKAGTIDDGTPIKTFEGLTGDEATLTITAPDAAMSNYDFKLYAVNQFLLKSAMLL